jgi:hypothetical protein
MKRNIISGIMLIGALALGSCSTTKLASNQANNGDDVYNSTAKAGDQIEYVASTQPAVNQQSRYNNYNDDDYYFYNSYSSRINRFGYFSPFGYYDDIYDGYYNPYFSSYNAGFNYGIGLGYGAFYTGYSPFYGSYGLGYNYGGYYPGYYGYNYFGTGYGYGGGYGGGGGYWGGVSAYRNSGTPRPYRGSGAPSNAIVSRSTRPIGYNGNYPVNSAYPGRPTVNNSNGRQATNSTGNNPYNGTRPSRGGSDNQASRPVYQPQQTQSYTPPPSSNSGSSSSGSSSSSSGSSGGARPARP